jgi:hypothetical protein
VSKGGTFRGARGWREMVISALVSDDHRMVGQLSYRKESSPLRDIAGGVEKDPAPGFQRLAR